MIALGLFGLREAVAVLNPPASNWAEPLTAMAAVTLALMAIVPRLWPGAFHRDRVFRLTLLALIFPVISYVYLVATGGVPA